MPISCDHTLKKLFHTYIRPWMPTRRSLSKVNSSVCSADRSKPDDHLFFRGQCFDVGHWFWNISLRDFKQLLHRWRLHWTWYSSRPHWQRFRRGESLSHKSWCRSFSHRAKQWHWQISAGSGGRIWRHYGTSRNYIFSFLFYFVPLLSVAGAKTTMWVAWHSYVKVRKMICRLF